MTNIKPLEKDFAAFQKHLPELQQQNGKFAVFVDGTLEGVVDTLNQAYQKGFAKAGSKPFLVRQITAIPVIQHFARMAGYQCHTSS
jgi:hypothetical protein